MPKKGPRRRRRREFKRALFETPSSLDTRRTVALEQVFKVSLFTEQMMELWEEMKKETGLGFAKCLTGPKGVGKSYITWFLAAKAYAHGWPVLYIADANTLADCQENVRASRVICQRFLDLNKDILTAKELSTMANCGSVEAIAEYILGDLLQQQGKKTLFIVDEHGALFPDNVPSATTLQKFERSVLRNSDYVVDVGPLSQDTFEKLFKIAIARFTLTTQRTLDSRKDAVIKAIVNTSSVLKFQMSEYDTSDPIIHSLQSQLATLTSRLEALSTSSESSRSNPYLVPKEPAYEITPDDSILVHYPAMDGKDFFKHKSGNRADDLAYATEMAKEMQSFAKNTTQTYSAPKSALIDWPDSSSHHSSMDKTISRYQSRLANLTRPLDQFATEMFSYEVDPAVAQACLQLAQTMREHIAHLAQQMSSDREDLVYQAHKISVTKDTV
ncbi:hypothetical protein BCR41DRAFT_402741 [Lobosporangium transversale]|uniref:Uncharacterized protein n=1 Tax=Lobosporangium transversale TaxID=64571 RepID=A0A1Y2FYR4_9FUNG|nr:hypothetical protein BCR41DRAFT_402741 [Lobosporangium transversale]ORY89186.1 hypothetical protein BCR41DRAFT_402741 [Lobosporangium transversale]|eukprot:XP_021875041.1 hypothetical protein BCR41DRAFT_402741 [Lobosporangium transversale]